MDSFCKDIHGPAHPLSEKKSTGGGSRFIGPIAVNEGMVYLV
jgi:hypothetical protein